MGPQNVISYTVQPGDNLTRIANLNGTTVAAILALNGDAIPYGNYIYAGQVIQVPVGYVG
ncbi:MAG: LysM peptidoglycan-binding domain-containing protein [Chloroflexi bacterium]|nr:LysM peptidoglycan-binding domain-containing protein [Chloroflexota bacterium]